MLLKTLECNVVLYRQQTCAKSSRSVPGNKFLVTIKSVQEAVKDFSREPGYQDICAPLRADLGGCLDTGSESRNLNLMRS